MRRQLASFLVAASVTTIAAADVAVLVAGPDEPDIVLPEIIPTLVRAGYCVTHLPDIADLDTADLSPFDVVWLTNGVSINNPAQPARQVVPNPAGEANLVAFLQNGGGLYMPGEQANPDEADFAAWRDPFLSDTLGAGFVNGVCNCSAGSLIYIDEDHPTATTPNDVPIIDTVTPFTGAYVSFGAGTPLGWSEPDETGFVIAVRWDRGALANAPAGQIISLNNGNNGEDFADWAVNVVAYLGDGAGGSGPDFNDDGVVDAADLATLLAAWGPCAGCCPEDLDGDGAVGPGDLAALLAAWG